MSSDDTLKLSIADDVLSNADVESVDTTKVVLSITDGVLFNTDVKLSDSELSNEGDSCIIEEELSTEDNPPFIMVSVIDAETPESDLSTVDKLSPVDGLSNIDEMSENDEVSEADILSFDDAELSVCELSTGEFVSAFELSVSLDARSDVATEFKSLAVLASVDAKATSLLAMASVCGLDITSLVPALEASASIVMLVSWSLLTAEKSESSVAVGFSVDEATETRRNSDFKILVSVVSHWTEGLAESLKTLRSAILK